MTGMTVLSGALVFGLWIFLCWRYGLLWGSISTVSVLIVGTVSYFLHLYVGVIGEIALLTLLVVGLVFLVRRNLKMKP